jgi:electron transport complex protein RnfC
MSKYVQNSTGSLPRRFFQVLATDFWLLHSPGIILCKMLGLNGKRKNMPGGLYFGPPGWTPQRWRILDAASVVAPPSARHAMANTQDLLDAVEVAGIGRTAPWLHSLRAQLQAVKPEGVRAIIANFLPLQPESALPRAIAENGMDDAILGLDIVRRCVPAKSISVVIDRHDRAARKQCRNATRKSGMRVVPLLNVYPQADPTVLIWTLLGQKLCVGELPPVADVLMLDPVACWALGRFVRQSDLYRRRPVQIFSADAAPQVVLASIGMPIDALLTQLELKYTHRQCIRNGMLTGEEIDPAASVIAGDTEMLSLRPRPAVENPSPCIECGWCVDHCPTALNPAQLYHGALAAPHAGMEAGESRHCIECGLCSYVCPTRLPLMRTIAELRSQPAAQPGHDESSVRIP